MLWMNFDVGWTQERTRSQDPPPPPTFPNASTCQVLTPWSRGEGGSVGGMLHMVSVHELLRCYMTIYISSAVHFSELGRSRASAEHAEQIDTAYHEGSETAEGCWWRSVQQTDMLVMISRASRHCFITKGGKQLTDVGDDQYSKLTCWRWSVEQADTACHEGSETAEGCWWRSVEQADTAYHEESETAEGCWWSEENAGWRDWCKFNQFAGHCALLCDKLQVYHSLFVMQAPAHFQSTRYINTDFSHKMQDAERPATKLVGLMCV